MSYSEFDEWFDRVQVGDVLVEKGSYRIVRRVSKNKADINQVLAFTIKRCSWTGCALTFVNRTDVRRRGFKPAGVRVKLNSLLDDKIAHDSGAGGDNRVLSCCDVKGIA